MFPKVLMQRSCGNTLLLRIITFTKSSVRITIDDVLNLREHGITKYIIFILRW